VRLVFRPAAAADLEEAFVWYEEQLAGLGAEFLHAAEVVLIRARSNPTSEVRV
jgi:hypothetical protein